MGENMLRIPCKLGHFILALVLKANDLTLGSLMLLVHKMETSYPPSR